jgi:hypothetical protein
MFRERSVPIARVPGDRYMRHAVSAVQRAAGDALDKLGAGEAAPRDRTTTNDTPQ